MTRVAAIYMLAALAEIGGCYSFWLWLREGRPAWLLIPGIACLIAFAWLLTQVDTAAAGRAYAAYGGIYIMAAVGWMAVVEKVRPDRWDLIGMAICLAGAAVILFGPRAARP